MNAVKLLHVASIQDEKTIRKKHSILGMKLMLSI